MGLKALKRELRTAKAQFAELGLEMFQVFEVLWSMRSVLQAVGPLEQRVIASCTYELRDEIDGIDFERSEVLREMRRILRRLKCLRRRRCRQPGTSDGETVAERREGRALSKEHRGRVKYRGKDKGRRRFGRLAFKPKFFTVDMEFGGKERRPYGRHGRNGRPYLPEEFLPAHLLAHLTIV